MHEQLDVRPVVEPGAFEVAILQRETERLDEMQTHPGRGRQACGAPAVVRDLRMNEDDFQAGSGGAADVVG